MLQFIEKSYYSYLQMTKVKSINNKKRFLIKKKTNERTLVSEIAILGLCSSLLMGLGQDQQQHPAVDTRGGSVLEAVGVNDM